ncbi:DUF6119 family protein, partial [Hyphococcus aureus]
LFRWQTTGNPIDGLCQHIEGLGYSEQKLTQSSINNNNLRLFYKRYPMTPKWKGFLADVTAKTEAALEEDQSRQENFVLLMENQATQSLYALSGGYGHSAISKYINVDFGLDVLARLVTKDEKSLKSTKEKSLVGGILGTSKFFRSSFNFHDNEEFGRIYQELRAKVEKDLLVAHFGFSENEVKRGAVVTAKSSFRINTSISINKVIDIITACERILQQNPSLVINSVTRLTKQKHESLIALLENELFSQLWNRFNGGLDSYPFDLCHTDFETYLTAQSYEVQIRRSRKEENADTASRVIVNYFGDKIFDEFSDVDVLFAEMHRSINIRDEKHFSNQLKKIRILSYDNDGRELTQADFLSHVMGDITLSNKKYFYVDKSWYLIQDSFLNDLNESCSSFVRNNSAPFTMKAWDSASHSENEYNASHIGEENSLVLDKIIPENIELCDIMKWDENKLYLIHVKSGFSNTMRDLCAQIAIAANRLSQDTKAQPPLTFLSAVYDSLLAKKGAEAYFGAAGDQTDQISKDEFLSLFEKEIVFVLAVLDTASNQRDLSEADTFNSSIAKFSLHVLVRNMMASGQRLQVTQIPPI